MAQNRSTHRKSRVTPPKTAAAPAPRRRNARDRRLFWIRVVSAIIVLSMLITVIAGVISVL